MHSNMVGNAGQIRSCDRNTENSADIICGDLSIQDAHMSSMLGMEEKGMKPSPNKTTGTESNIW